MGIIAIDLDGTLINNDHKISEENIKAIKIAQKYHEVVIATGRAHFDAQKILDRAGLSLYIIGANGATIHSPSGRKIHSVPMPEAKTKEIVLWLEQQKLYYELFCNCGIYTPIEGRKIILNEMKELMSMTSKEELEFMKKAYEKQIGQTGFIYMNDYKQVFDDKQKINNILVFSFDDVKRNAGKKKYKNDSDLTMVTSSKYNFELEHKNASKGNALSYLSKILKIDMNYSMAVGDSENDLSMFKVVKNSYAMDNADKNIKAKSKYTTANNDQHGVAKAIYSYLDFKNDNNQ